MPSEPPNTTTSNNTMTTRSARAASNKLHRRLLEREFSGHRTAVHVVPPTHAWGMMMVGRMQRTIWRIKNIPRHVWFAGRGLDDSSKCAGIRREYFMSVHGIIYHDVEAIFDGRKTNNKTLCNASEACTLNIKHVVWSSRTLQQPLIIIPTINNSSNNNTFNRINI